MRFRESLGAVFVGAGADVVADFGADFVVDAAGLGIRPNRNSGGGAAADTSAPAGLTGAGSCAGVPATAAAAAAAAITIAAG